MSDRFRRASPDFSMIGSLLKNVEDDLKYLDKQKVDDYSSRKLVVAYYDSLRSVLEALASRESLKIYEHEAYTPFLNSRDEEKIIPNIKRLFEGLYSQRLFYKSLLL